MIPNHLANRDKNYKDRQQFTLDKVFFNSSVFNGDASFMENTLRGQITEPANAFDGGFNEAFKTALFNEELDLLSLNIQRGREHGLAGYNKYREVCASLSGYEAVNNFDQLTNDGYLTPGDVGKLKKVYKDVDDIDLFVGGMLEKSEGDALVGPVFKCIIGDQFIRLKEGDRFWYENDDPQTRFTRDQLLSIKQTSMARIVCDNSDMTEIQPVVFRTETDINRITSCDNIISIPELDLEPWRE